MASRLAVCLLVCSAVARAMDASRSGDTSAVTRQQSLEQQWSSELDRTGVTPVQRVVALLNKMKAELEAEADKESEMYDKMVCWCETNEKEKTKAVAEADAADLQLQSEIEERGATFGKLSTEIDAMKKQIAEDTATLKQATSLREKSASEFRGEEKDLVQAITNLKNAIAVLSRHQGGNLMQLNAPLLSGLKVVLHDIALKHEAMVARSTPRTALVALGSIDKRADAAQSSTSSALLNILDHAGESAEQALPLKFAERILMRESQRATSSSFLQASSSDTAQKQPLSASYSTQSDGIFGILKQMLEEFEAELSTTQKEEAQASTDHAALAAAKEEQIALGKEKLDAMEADHAKNQKALSDAKENLEATRNQRTADVEFLRNLKLTCNDLDSQWDKRSQTRSAELKAVAETIAILTENDNREQLVKSSVAFLQMDQQVSSGSGHVLRAKAVQMLKRAAQAPAFDADDLLAAWRGRGHGQSRALLGAAAGPRVQLSTLAVSVQLDSFEKVKKMMDQLVAELKKQQEEEVAFKAYCGKEFNENEKATYAKTQEKNDLEATMDQLDALLKKLAEEIAEAQSQTAETQIEVKKASETREKENAEFQTTIADQRAMQEILKKALNRLEDFYTKGLGKAVLMQRQAQTPPVQFNDYKTNAGASPVMGLLEQIIEDSKKLEAEATADEYKAQADYETMVKDSNDLIAQLSASITTKTKASAAAKLEKGEAESSHVSAVGELESLAAVEADLHSQCDFVLANFDIRQKARLQEMEAIQSAKGILSGA